MGIQSTRYIEREDAIRRIANIDEMLTEKRYRDLELNSSESASIGDLVSHIEPTGATKSELAQWTDDMLATQMDRPLYRYSFLDNYLIESENTVY